MLQLIPLQSGQHGGCAHAALLITGPHTGLFPPCVARGNTKQLQCQYIKLKCYGVPRKPHYQMMAAQLIRLRTAVLTSLTNPSQVCVIWLLHIAAALLRNQPGSHHQPLCLPPPCNIITPAALRTKMQDPLSGRVTSIKSRTLTYVQPTGSPKALWPKLCTSDQSPELPQNSFQILSSQRAFWLLPTQRDHSILSAWYQHLLSAWRWKDMKDKPRFESALPKNQNLCPTFFDEVLMKWSGPLKKRCRKVTKWVISWQTLRD